MSGSISDAVSSARWGEWRGLEELPPSRLVRRQTERYTRREWTWLVTATMALYNVCPLKLTGGTDAEGVPTSLVPILPDRLSYVMRPGALEAEVYLDGVSVDPGSFAYVRRMLLPGMTQEQEAIFRLARMTIGAAYAAGEYRGSYWASGGAPTIVLTSDQKINQDQADDWRERWVDRRSSHPGEPAVLGQGLHAEKFGADMSGGSGGMTADGELGASIARVMGVPPHLVNVPSYASSLTYQNTESAGLDLVRYTLEPYSDAIGDVMGDLLPGDYIIGRRVRLDLRHLSQAEQGSRFAAWSAALDPSTGWMSIDEVRANEGLAPLGGDAALVSSAKPAPEPPAPDEEPELRLVTDEEAA